MRNLVKWTPTTQEVSVLLVARVRLSLNRWSCSCTRTPEEEESNATHDDPFVDPELIILEEGWRNHKMDEGNFDPKLVAVAKQKGLRKSEKPKSRKRSSNVIQKQSRLEPKGCHEQRHKDQTQDQSPLGREGVCR